MKIVVTIILFCWFVMSDAPFYYIRSFLLRQISKKYNLGFNSNYSKLSILFFPMPTKKEFNILEGKIGQFDIRIFDFIFVEFHRKRETLFFLNNKKVEYKKGVNFFRLPSVIDQWLKSISEGKYYDLGKDADKKRRTYYLFVIIIIIAIVLFYLSLTPRAMF